MIPALALALCCFQGGRIVIHRPSDPVVIHWRPITIKPAELRKRAQFPVYAPAQFKGFRLSKTQVLWVPKVKYSVELPARQAVRVYYLERASGREFSILYSPTFKGSPIKNMMYLFDAGCFGISKDASKRPDLFSTLYGAGGKVDLYWASRSISLPMANDLFGQFQAEYQAFLGK